LKELNKIAPRKIFRDRLNTDLIHKLVEIREINEGLTLEEWYLKTVEFERTKQVVEGIFEKQATKLLGLVSRIKRKLT